MTDVKRLLDEATPLPWPDFASALTGPYSQTERALIVHAVNHLPDYEAAVDALAGLTATARYHADHCYLRPDKGECDCGVMQEREVALAALRRVRP